MYILSNGSTTYRYWFDGADGAVHTVEELHGMTITLNGQAVDGDITKGFTIHNVTASDMKGYENTPYGWVLDGDSEDDHYTYTAHPEDSDTPSVQYTFMYDDTRPHDSINSLRNLKAYLTVDGSAVKGFDYTLANTDTIAIPMNTDVRLEGVPDGWKVDYNNPSTGKLNRVYTLTGPVGTRSPTSSIRLRITKDTITSTSSNTSGHSLTGNWLTDSTTREAHGVSLKPPRTSKSQTYQTTGTLNVPLMATSSPTWYPVRTIPSLSPTCSTSPNIRQVWTNWRM